MNSLRNQLLGWLLPSFIALYTIAAVSLYQVEKAQQYEKLDQQLRHVVNMMRSELLRSPGKSREQRLSIENLQRVLALVSEDERINTLYYQVLNHKKELVLRSESLAEVQLHIRPGPMMYTQAYTEDLTLYIRNVSIPERRLRNRLVVSIALDNAEAISKLSQYKQLLILGGVVFCLLFALILIFVLRKTLRPVENLAQLAANMNADNLSQRFAANAMPSEIRPFINKLNDLISRLDNSFARERQFSNDLAHEMRTPLAAIRSVAEVAQKWPSDNINDELADIELLSKQMQNMVDTLLTLARLDSDNHKLEEENIALAPFLQHIVKLHEKAILTKQLTFKLNEIDADASLHTDKNLFHILWSNLIGNAVSYAPNGTQVKLMHTVGCVSICNVCDGLTEADLDNIFERFWRHDSARTNQAHSGLGLSIAKRCAQLMQGQLTVELQQHESGTQIYFHFFYKK
ncbi:heavy metal sensor kinase [Catenovulum agarivorans DS-2]|uniref:histidine kinase n=1 Tax=Catenovulum agarivorans DS-2 TaxID=1328313 RepID=W7QL14_9ALTE|nr:ATP-binding protein [Catenovulum agarivorans]EWH08808.1 heavy metal sensor kinase [Catenovulum agarivorans DS-2]